MINDRQKEILKMIVEDYIKTAKPVGSEGICKKIKCSSATVRNEMSYLENVGYLEKTHTSSGRIPSEDGYRYYVNNLMVPKNMTGEEMLKLQTVFNNSSLMLSDPIRKSIEIISEITNCASVVLGSKSSINKLMKVEVVPLEKNKILTMVITDKGFVEHKNLFLPDDISTDDVKQTVDLINKLLIGTPIDEISIKLEYEIKPIIGKYVKQHEVLYNAFYNAFSELSNNQGDVHFVGKNNFLKQPEFGSIEKVKELLNKFDDVSLIEKDSPDNNDINVYIGSENNFDDDLTVIKTKYNYNGEEGTIALVGPKRMEYDRVIGVLDYLKNNMK